MVKKKKLRQDFTSSHSHLPHRTSWNNLEQLWKRKLNRGGSKELAD